MTPTPYAPVGATYEQVRRTWTAAEVTKAIYDYWTFHGHAVFLEVPTASAAGERRIDALAIGATPLGALELHAFEVKVSRQDFMADVRNPAKQAPWRALADSHRYVVPAELGLTAADVPEWSILTEIVTLNHPIAGPFTTWRSTTGTAHADVPPSPLNGARDRLIRDLLGRGANAEGLISGMHGLDHGDSPEYLRAEVIRLREQLGLAVARADRAVARTKAWKGLAARQGHKVPCSACGAAVIPTRVAGGELVAWRHAQPDLTVDCPANATGVHPREDGEP